MPRLPRKVPLSKKTENGHSAALVFACNYCHHSNHWSFIAYNIEGRVFQQRRCTFWACFATMDGEKPGGRWITQDEEFELTKEWL